MSLKILGRRVSCIVKVIVCAFLETIIHSESLFSISSLTVASLYCGSSRQQEVIFQVNMDNERV